MATCYTSYEPLPRSDHVAIAMGSKLYMWGGWGESNEKTLEVAKMVEVLDISIELWEQKPTHGTLPPGLWFTAYTVVESCLYVFGGHSGESCHNSLFKLDLKSFQWEKVRVSNSSSAPRRKNGCGMVCYGDNQLVVFAGYTGSEMTDELHIFKLNDGECSVHTK